MMYIDTVTRQYTWNLGELPKDENGDPESWVSPVEVDHIQADGPELEFILNHCRNIPTISPAERMVWYGDDAKFIFGNITILNYGFPKLNC